MVLISGSHEPVAVAAAEMGRHVFIEKPIALSEQEGRRIIAAGKKHGVTLMVGYMKRYDPAVERMAEELGRTDRLRYALSVTAEFPLKWYIEQYDIIRGNDIAEEIQVELRQDDERRVTAAIGQRTPVLRFAYRNSLLDSMIHDINLMRSLAGDIRELQFASLSEAGVAVFARFAKGPGAMNWVYLKDGIAAYRQDFTFFTPERRATLVFPSPFLRNEPTKIVLDTGKPDAPESWRTEKQLSYQEAFKNELLEFYECITLERQPRTTAEDAVRDVALCQEIIRRFGQPAP
jgi:predicted dehydrogenase